MPNAPTTARPSSPGRWLRLVLLLLVGLLAVYRSEDAGLARIAASTSAAAEAAHPGLPGLAAPQP